MLDEAGLPQARIFASGGLDEHEVHELVRAGAPVDAFGVGTQMGVSADAPYVDSVYKLTEYDGRPVLKLSAGQGDARPDRKQVWRGDDGDLIAPARRGRAATARAAAGAGDAGRPARRAVARRSTASRARFDRDLRTVPAKARRLSHPEHVRGPAIRALQALTAARETSARRERTAEPARAASLETRQNVPTRTIRSGRAPMGQVRPVAVRPRSSRSIFSIRSDAA